MELQFEKNAWECLRPVVSQVKNEEHTMEVRLPESMPDIGRVLATWGQVLLRGKEWRGSGMTVSGGIMAWVLYQPEDGTEAKSVEAWIPFQTRWDFPQTERDGNIWVSCLLRSIDSRSLSARKLMVRAGVSMLGEAFEPVHMDIYTPGKLPEDIHLRHRRYPVRLPREAGEKSFALDEEVTVPPSEGVVSKIIRWELQPEILEHKVMAGKIVFRGTAWVHMLYMDDENQLKTWEFEIPFSQFEDLLQEYGQEAEAQMIPAVTGMELEIAGDNHIRLKAGLVGQYVITDRKMMEMVVDAYSNRRTVQPKVEQLPLPAVLDSRSVTMQLDGRDNSDGQHVLDTAFLCPQTMVHRENGAVELEQNGAWQLLLQDREGRIQGQVVNAATHQEMKADADSRIVAFAMPKGKSQGEMAGGQIHAHGEVLVETRTVLEQGIPMVTGLEVGELKKPDANRPSMILRRPAGLDLWSIAKTNGSTVEAICAANRIQGEPEEGQMLLIPVL